MSPLTHVFFLVVGCIAVTDARKKSEKVCTLLQDVQVFKKNRSTENKVQKKLTGEKCTASYYTECTPEFLKREYPGLYKHNNSTTTTPHLEIKTRVNFTKQIENKVVWYSEFDVIIRENRDSSAGIQGYEVWIESIQGLRCVVVTVPDKRTLTNNEKMVYVKFKDVRPGVYQVKVEPYDDLEESKNKTCHCKINARCNSCGSTISEILTIMESQPYTAKPARMDTKTSLKIPRNNIKKILNTPQSANGTTLNSFTKKIFMQTLQELRQNSGKIEGSQRSGKEWIIPLSILCVIVVAVFFFAVVRFKRGVQPKVAKSTTFNQTELEKSVLIIHDIKHSKHAISLMKLIIQDLQICVESEIFPNKDSLINYSDSRLIILWMTPQSFKKFEWSLLKDKEISSKARANFESRFVVIESKNAGCFIQPRIQYRIKFVLDTELELFLDFLRNNIQQKLRKSLTKYQHVSTKIPEKPSNSQESYGQMDSGFQSELENEVVIPNKGNNHEEYASIAAVTIAEYHMGVPSLHQHKATSLFSQFDPSNPAIFENGNGFKQNSDTSNSNKNFSFISPKAMSCYDIDASYFSEDMLFLNEGYMRSTESSQNSLFLIDQRVNKHFTWMDYESEHCFQDMIRNEKEKEETEYEGRTRIDEDAISIGGQSC